MDQATAGLVTGCAVRDAVNGNVLGFWGSRDRWGEGCSISRPHRAGTDGQAEQNGGDGTRPV
ncbi:hypothetical protein AA100600_0947 [Gluconobacter thailandicus F149-1 = NBRC 100600]|nr:hypothetical protein AA100600_0947 [Gluconobacter thailandicus F149-1 = NBRC 100600]